MEKAYIVYFNSIENGYNICRGGNGTTGHKVPGAEKHMDYLMVITMPTINDMQKSIVRRIQTR